MNKDKILEQFLPAQREAVAQILQRIETLQAVEVPKVIEQIPFAYELAALEGVLLTEKAPFSGYIIQVDLHFPDGCDALVDVRVGHGTRQFCPNEGFLALNDATPSYPFNEWVEDDEEIWVEMRNTDAANPHNISVAVTEIRGIG